MFACFSFVLCDHFNRFANAIYMFYMYVTYCTARCTGMSYLLLCLESFFFLSFILMLGYFILFLKFSLHSLVYVTVLNSWIQMFMHSLINGSHGKVVESHDLTTYLPSLCHILTVIFIRKTKSHAIGYNINYN